MSNQIIAEASIDVNEAPRQAEQAQNTANNAFSGVKTINDPNQLGPAEKATLKRKYDQDLLLYSMDKKKLNDAQLSTTEIDNAMSALSAYMTPLFSNMKTVDTIDRDTLNQLFSDFDTADKNSDGAFTNMVSNAASEAVVAGNQASEAASNASVQASVAVSNANVAQSSVVAAIAKAEFASDAASAASQAASDAKAIASQAANNVAIAKNDAANALTSAATAFNVANVAQDSAASALSKVNGMQFGGTNLLRDTGFSEDGHPYWQGPADLGVTDGYLNHNAVSFDETSLTGSNYIDFQQIIYDNNTKLIKLGQWHALSFYAKGSGKFASFVYPLTIDENAGAYIDGQFTIPAEIDGNHFWTLTDDWVRHTYIFKTNASISTDTNAVQRVLWRTYAGTKVSICMPQLETGNVVSDYSQSPLDVQVQISDINGQLESKVSQTTYDQLAGLVSDTSTLAQQNKSELLTKANEQTVDLLKQTVDNQATSIDETAKKVELKADESKVNALTDTVTNNASKLSVMSDSIDGLSTKTQSVGDQLITLQGNFNLSSQQWETNFSKVTNNLSNVGAPNLVSATGWTTGADGSGSPSTIVTHGFYKGTQPLYTIYNKSTLENYAYSQRFDLKPNTTYVVRFIGFEDVHVSSMDLFVLARKSGETVDHTQVYNPVKGIVLSSSGTQEVKNYTFTTGADVNSGYIRIDNNGSKDGSTGGLYFTEVQLEEGSVSTPYRRSEADQATVTALTQVKQTAEGAQALATNNQGDITNLQATAKGIQTTVSNNYSDLKSQVTQTDSAWRVALSNTGQTNLVYNSNFNDNAEGWTTNSQGYLTEDPAGTYQGSPGWAINKTNTGWIEFGRSKLYKLPVTDVRADNTYSAVALVKPYGDFTDGNALGTTLAYFDANQNRVSGWHDMMVVSSASTRNVWTLVKCEDYKVPANAVYIGLQFQAHNISGTVHGVINHPMITSGPTIGPYTESTSDLATQSDITQSISNIHLGFKNSNGSTFQMNLSADGVALMDFSKIMLNGATNIANGTIGTAQIADAAITNAKITNLDASKITTGTLDASHIDSDQLIATLIDGKTINAVTLNTPSLNMGDNGQITGTYSVNDDTGWFQPINGTGKLNIDHGYIQSTANILYYNKLMNGMGDKWGHWESSTTFVPAPDQAHPDVNNVAESTLTPAFLKLDIFNADKSLVNSRAYLDGTGLYINDGGTQAISSMLSDWELLSNGMAYLMGGVQMKKESSFTFGNLAMNGYHTIAMLDGKALYFQDKPGSGGNTIELVAKTFTKSSQLSLKHDITSLSTAEASRLLNAIDVEKYRYIHDGATRAYQYGGIIDNQNELGKKKYSLPAEFLNEDGTGINLDSLTGVLIKKVQDQDKMIGELSMRLTKLEMTA